MYKYTATSWLFTSVAKDLNWDDREQMQRDSNPGLPDCECNALTTRATLPLRARGDLVIRVL